jgi:hypothetical protein
VGKFSIQYVAACALLDGGVSIDSFTDERYARMLKPSWGVFAFGNPRIFRRRSDQMWVEVRLALTDSTRVSARCMRPRAAWDEPPSDDEHMLSVNDCMQRAFDNKDDRGMHRAYAKFRRI